MLKDSKQTNERYNILSPKLDIVFQILFGEVGSEKITKDFLNSILDEEVYEVDLNQNIVLRRELSEDKMGIVDVLAKVNDNEYCNIEMQMVDKKNIVKRLLYYWARQYSRQLKKSKDYNDLKRTIIILIANFKIKHINDLPFHSRWKIIEEKDRKIVLTEDFELNIIELPKINGLFRLTQKEKKLQEWLYFLENPESKEVASYMKSNDSIKEAKNKLEEMSQDAKVRRIAELREKAILDEKEAEYTGYCNGLEDGIKQGIEQNQKDVAKKLKNKGTDIDFIIEITGLSKEDIENL
mgnify:CR=1 FL=1